MKKVLTVAALAFIVLPSLVGRLDYELFKRIAPVMLRRLQAARKKMLSIHAHGEKLEPVIGLSPFMAQELDTYPDGDADIRVISRRVD